MEREPNRLLQQLIAEAGFSHKGLARRLNDLGAARGTPGLKYDHSSVLRWIGGQRPRDPVPGLLTENGDASPQGGGSNGFAIRAVTPRRRSAR